MWCKISDDEKYLQVWFPRYKKIINSVFSSFILNVVKKSYFLCCGATFTKSYFSLYLAIVGMQLSGLWEHDDLPQHTACPVSIPVRSWHCCIIRFRGSIEQKSPSEQCNRGAIMEDRLLLSPRPPLAPTHPTGANYRICFSGRSNMENAWHLDALL